MDNQAENMTADAGSSLMERVEFLSDKSLFKGKVYRPANLAGCKGIVIFTHGLGYCDRQYSIDGKYFADNNYMMLTYNLRGHAGTPGKWTLNNSVEDLLEGINFLTRKYEFENRDRICVIGHSTGALITLLASLRDKRIKFGSVVTTVTCLRDSYLYWFKSGFNREVKDLFRLKGYLAPVIERFFDDETAYNLYREGKIPQAELEVPHRYGLLKSDSWNEFFHEIAFSVDVLDQASKIQIPLLLFRGEYDEIMDVRKTNELYDRLDKKIPSKLYITDSRNHFHNDKWAMIQAETLKFFDVFCDFNKKKEDVDTKDILIIDDELIVTKTLQNLLRKHGITRVSIANSGEEALRKITELKNRENRSFNMIISDIRMPGLDGIETIRRMKQIVDHTGKESSVIFMTGYEGERTQQEAKALGYVDYLYKPFDVEDFVASVRKHLET